MSLLQKRSGWIPPLFPVQGLYSFFSLLFFLFFKHRTVSISCIRPDGKLIRSETASKRLRQGIGRLLFVSIFSNSFLFFPGANLAYIGERTEPRWEIPADIIARSCRGNNKKIRDEVDGKKEKTVSRISSRERYAIDRPSNVASWNEFINVSRRFDFQL